MAGLQNGSHQNGHANGHTNGTDTAAASSEPVKVVISGAGPAGLLLAHYLLSFGKDKFRVIIYDKAEDPRETLKQTLNYRRYSSRAISKRHLEASELECLCFQESLVERCFLCCAFSSHGTGRTPKEAPFKAVWLPLARRARLKQCLPPAAVSTCRYTIGIARRGENVVRVVPGLVEKVRALSSLLSCTGRPLSALVE